jgi:L-amino acid N-acyltransferase YncA
MGARYNLAQSVGNNIVGTMLDSPLHFLTTQSGKDVKVTATFAGLSDVMAIYWATWKMKADVLSVVQKSARTILENLLAEFEYYQNQRSFAGSREQLLNLQRKGLSEFGAIVVFKIDEEVVGAALFHATWKGSVYLDWMAALPEFLKNGKKIAGLGKFMLQTVLYVAQQLGADLTFIESIKGAAARYKEYLGLKEECDFILLAWNPDSANAGWHPCPQIYGLAKRNK